MIGWDKLSFPKEWGGRGIKNNFWFNTTLRTKSFWRAITGNTLWSDIFEGKYIKPIYVTGKGNLQKVPKDAPQSGKVF